MGNSKNDITRIITIASGKGGVGKTNIAVNLAMSLSEERRKVCLLDADIGLANVDVLLGMHSEHSLADYIANRCTLNDIMLTGPGSLKIIPGGTALDRPVDVDIEERKILKKLFESLQEYDTLVIDVSAGISDQILRFFEAANIPILIIIPEPTSLIDAYALLKIYYNKGNEGPVYILVNQAKSTKHAVIVYNKFEEAVKKHLDIIIKPIGYILSDANIPEAVSQQRPCVELFPNSPASLCIKHIATDILSDQNRTPSSGGLKHLLFSKEPDITEDEVHSNTDNSKKTDSEQAFAGEIISLLIKDGHISVSQVNYARKIQKKLDTPRRLLDLVKELRYINDEQIKKTLYAHRTGIRIGSMLVELGYIAENQLAAALNQQKQSNGKQLLGEILIANNYITKFDFTQVLSMNLGYPYVQPQLETLDVSLLKKSSEEFFLKHNFLPISKKGEIINIAMTDPLNKSAVKAVKSVFGDNIAISLTMEHFIKEVLTSYKSLGDDKKPVEKSKAEVVKIVDGLILDAVEKNVSDIHLEPGKNTVRVRFRKDGSLLHYMDLPISLKDALSIRIKVMSSIDITEKRRHQGGRILMVSPQSGEEIDIRVSFYITIFGEKVVLRLLRKKAELYKIEDLGMGPKVLNRFREEALDLPSGVVIITGPTGAGKTTTLYASINYCNSIDVSIITAEEPVEYVIEGISQCPIDPKIGQTYEETLRHIMRQDPDIIILGEIRDKSSAESAIQAALTGHKVITTFHTEDSIGGLLRLMNMNIESFLISSTVVCVVAQRLLKKVCPYCQENYIPTAKDLRRLNYQPQNIRGYDFQIGKGCIRCEFTGYSGRIGVFEMLVLNEYVKEAILLRKTSSEIRRISMDTTGLITLLEDGLSKAAKGLISIPEVIKHLPLLEAPRPIELICRLAGDV